MMKDPANILVFCIVIIFISLVVYGAIQSRMEAKKKNENKKEK